MSPSAPAARPVRSLLDQPEVLDFLRAMVSIAPINVEDPVRGRVEKPNYLRAADQIVRTARRFGLATRIFDPLTEAKFAPDFRGIPRPNVIIDVDRGAEETDLVLAHYDVVPVPAEQRHRWLTPPHTLSLRADGRLYGRGANDDLGSGVTAALWALRRLVEDSQLRRNVRLIVTCDEETGGEGGIEAIRSYDRERPPEEQILRGDVALIPDGSPHTTAGSSGGSFVEANFGPETRLSQVVAFGKVLVDLQNLTDRWDSQYPSPDFPGHGAPHPMIHGRSSVTQADFRAVGGGGGLWLSALHAETDSANLIPAAVTLVFGGALKRREHLLVRLQERTTLPFRVESPTSSSISWTESETAVQVVGQSAHGGSPHLGKNPVPAAIDLLNTLLKENHLGEGPVGSGGFVVDLRLPPEMELSAGVGPVLHRVRAWMPDHLPQARVEAPASRSRRGYALPLDHPVLMAIEPIIARELGESGVYGEYGSTDASALSGLIAPGGEPLPVVVFGSMDRIAHIHDAEESVDPRLIAGVSRTIEQFVLRE